jgi:hypothetical protein
MPEGRYPLAQATLYLATAPKSNSIMGFFDALAAVEQEQQSDIPNHLKDANRDKKGLGHGANYLYPHAYRDHWVEQQYLPSSLQGRVFYQPSDLGKEAEIKTQVSRRREAQLAAQIEGMGMTSIEMLTYSETDKQVERWLQRTISQAGQKLGEIRDNLFDLAQLQRHHLILDLNAKSGLLTWEAFRQVPEGGVYACVSNQTEAEALKEQAATLPELLQPAWLPSGLWEKLKLAESAIYEDDSDPMVNWDSLDLKKDLEKVGLRVEVELERTHTSILITSALVERWFAPTQTTSRPTYRQHLERMLTGDEVNLVQQVFSKYLNNQTVTWSSTIAYLQVY